MLRNVENYKRQKETYYNVLKKGETTNSYLSLNMLRQNYFIENVIKGKRRVRKNGKRRRTTVTQGECCTQMG